MDALFDPESGFFASTSNSLLDLIDNFNMDNVLKFGNELIMLPEKIFDKVSETVTAIIEGNSDLVEKAKSVVNDVVDTIMGLVPDYFKDALSGAKSLFSFGESSNNDSVSEDSGGVFDWASDTAKNFFKSNVDPLAKTQANIEKRRQSARRMNETKIDTRPSEVARSKNEENLKLQKELAARQQQPVVVNNSSNTVVNTPPTIDIVSGSLNLATGGV
jgi:hypothetical protein